MTETMTPLYSGALTATLIERWSALIDRHVVVEQTVFHALTQSSSTVRVEGVLCEVSLKADAIELAFADRPALMLTREEPWHLVAVRSIHWKRWATVPTRLDKAEQGSGDLDHRDNPNAGTGRPVASVAHLRPVTATTDDTGA